MKKIISPSHSLSKKAFKQIKIYSDPKKNNIPPTKIKSSINNISEICNSIYEDFFPYILKISKIHFFQKFNKEVDDIFLSGKYKSENIKFVLESKEKFIKKYDNDFKYLNEEYDNYLKNKNKYKYLTHFRKHCIDTDYYAFHYCSSNKKGKFIEIKNKLIKNNNETSYVICEGCKQCYLSKFILMLCCHCNRKYFSNILKENEDGNILPATWKKYHCSSLVNAIMKCIKCRSTLYFNLVTKQLVCLNKKCNFNSKPESILWVCNSCNQEFRSNAKIYNPLEFQILKKSINFALLKQIKAAPRELPCHCTKNLSKLIFYHKDECQGELYKGMLIDRPILVCQKCKAINFEDKFTWICPICKIKFHLHRVIGCKPFSKKKYIINKSFNKSARNVPKKKLDKELLTNNLLSKSSIYNKNDLIILNKSVNDSHKSYHSKLNPSEDMNNISTFNTNSNDNFNHEKIFKKIDINKITNDRNKGNKEKELTKYYDYQKKAWIINLKKDTKKDISPNNNRHYKTLIDILKERMISDSGKESKEKNKFNKTMLPPQRIKNRNIIKRKKDILLSDKTDSNIISNTNYNDTIIKKLDSSIHRIFNRTINKTINKKEKEEEKKIDKKINKIIDKKEDKKDKYLLKNKIFNKIIKIDDNNKGKNNLIKIKNPKISSPFRSEISLKYHKIENNKKRNIFKYDSHNEEKKIKTESNEKKEINNLPISKTLSKNAPVKNNINNFYNSLQTNTNNSSSFINSINSFRFWKRRGTATSNENQKNGKIRFSKINDLLNSNKFETEPSFNENNNINGLRDSSRNNMNISLSSSFRFSFLGNNSILKPYNNLVINNISDINHNQKKDLVEEKKEINTFDIEKDDKNNDKEKKLEEESNYSDENYDKIDTLKEFMRKSKIQKEKEKEKEKKEDLEEKDDKFNDSFLYEKNEVETCEEEEIEDENKDIIKDIFINSNAKKNFRESLMLKSNFTRQSILISQDKLNNLADKTDIPSINESDYSYLKPIGEGTYGVVYLVENNETSEQFALKKIICRDYNELIKQKSELELIFSVKHENILKLYGLQFKYLDETTSAIYVLMELAQNDWNTEIKRRIIAKRYYKEYELINLLKQIIKGFLFLQDKNIAHRDIKPQNILLFPNNVYKIADFGEAKFIKNIAEQSTLRGSELYMSPLLYKGYKYNQKNVLHNPFKSDVFSLGYCLLYAMCLNLKVLEVVRELTTMKSIISNINKFIAKNKYSDKLINIVYKMIEPSEDLRYDFEDLSLELEKL